MGDITTKAQEILAAMQRENRNATTMERLGWNALALRAARESVDPEGGYYEHPDYTVPLDGSLSEEQINSLYED
jgi:hypothetical protein